MPRLVLCGHYHAAFGMTDKIGPSMIINPGPHGVVVEISNERTEVVEAGR